MAETQMTVYRRSELEGADCLHRYKAIWIDGVDDSSDYAIRGQAFAAIKHCYIMRLVAAQIGQDETEANLAFTEGIAQSRCPDRLIPEVRELWDKHAIHFELLLDRYVTAEEKQLPILCKACRRQWYVADVAQTGNTCPSCSSHLLELRPFGFTPDLVYAHPERNELEVVDDKTFFVALTATQAKASFQGRFYTRFAMDRWPAFSSYRFTFNFVRLGRQESVVYTAEDLAGLDREVEAAVAKIEHARAEDFWPATAGPSCTYCELKCPIADNPMIVPKRFTLPAQAQSVAQWILATETNLKLAKKALKQYCATAGAVDVQGVQFDNRPVEQRSYPLESVIEVLDKLQMGGALSPTGLTISHSALSKLFKSFPVMERDLAPLVQSKTTYRFGARKPGVGDFEEDE